MAINITRYVDITSGVGAGFSTPLRQLIARLFTTSTEIPTNTIVEFSDSTSVGEYFGSGSDEQLRAIYYFGFLSKLIRAPQTISFARWANTDVGATILGAEIDTTLAEFQAVDAGAFTITLGGTAGNVTALDLSSAASLADVATTIQSAIIALGGDFASSTVVYNATRSRFEYDSNNDQAETIAITDGAQTPLALLGWDDISARLSNGVEAQTPLEVVSETTDEDNNFGTFLFTTTLTDDQYENLAAWNQEQNIRFVQIVPVTSSTASGLSSLLIGYGGTSLELTNSSLDEYPEMLPMAIAASTDYTADNSTVAYMYTQSDSLTPLVTTDTLADLYDPLRVNYMGQTQQAGGYISIYQRGVLCGGSTYPTDWNVYVNEMWFKDYNTAGFLDLLVNLPKVSRNIVGRAQGRRVLRSGVNQALANGVISVGKELDNTDIEFITTQTGDANAYLQVQNNGYWYDVTFRTDTNEDGTTTEVLVYSLIYSKDDTVRFVDGRHILI